jgi:hypothetical protein
MIGLQLFPLSHVTMTFQTRSETLIGFRSSLGLDARPETMIGLQIVSPGHVKMTFEPRLETLIGLRSLFVLDPRPKTMIDLLQRPPSTQDPLSTQRHQSARHQHRRH